MRPSRRAPARVGRGSRGAALLGPAREAEIARGKRNRVVVVVAALDSRLLEVAGGGGDELLLGRAVEDALRPRVELAAERVEVPVDVVDEAEVDEREPLRCAAADLLDRRVPCVDIDVGRR